MASVHKQPGKPHWFCAFTTPDGKRHFKSTGTSDKRQAVEICNTWARSSQVARSGKLTQERARVILARGLEDVFSAMGQTTSSASTRKLLEDWLAAKELETSPATVARYRKVVDQLLEFLGAKADRDIALLSSRDLTEFRGDLAKKLSPATVNFALKTARNVLKFAHQGGFVTTNEAERVPLLKVRRNTSRKPFTLDQLKKILAVADDEWRVMILVGLYTGLRLRDVATLTWDNVDLHTEQLTVATSKTGRVVVHPMHPEVSRAMEAWPAGDGPSGPLFPSAYGAKSRSDYGGTLSNQFHRILVSAGLATSRPHTSQGKGRGARRQPSIYSFHSLRHTATSLLKNAGVSDVVARDLIGHDSAAVSRYYTHIDDATKRAAVGKMPGITAP